MIGPFRRWIEKRRSIRRLWQADAKELIRRDERNAFYAAQRLAARARADGDLKAFGHWAKVAAEVARLSPIAEMDYEVLKAIVDEEMANHPKAAT